MPGLHITTHDENGKLAGFRSLNTSVLDNSFCATLRGQKSVCQRCYAATMEKRFSNLRGKLLSNSTKLSSFPLAEDEMPVINDKVFRFHSLGELINEQHFENFLAIAERNPGTTFSLWSKRKKLVADVLKTRPKPPNLILIYSTTAMDISTPVLPPYFDRVFTVHTKVSTANINCVSKCRECMMCYSPSGAVVINERLK